MIVLTFKAKDSMFLFEDEHIIILNKPAGLLSIPDRSGQSSNSLLSQLRIKYPNILTVHRLDKDTSGTIVFAKTTDAHQRMNQLFQERKTKKRYLAIACGNPEKNEAEISSRISNPGNGKKVFIDERMGKTATTSIVVLERYDYYCLIDINISSGRMHQIRVHMSSIGHPLAIDPIYNDTEKIFLSSIKRRYKHKKGIEERPLMSRLSLHSSSISFTHPYTKKNITITSELPKDFKAFLNQLRKNAV